MPPSFRLAFLNQSVQGVFLDLAADLAAAFGPSVMLASLPGIVDSPGLRIVGAPAYRRDSDLDRLSSWIRYASRAATFLARLPGKPLVFVVSPSPLLPALAATVGRARGLRYVVLVHDVYPDILERFGRIRRGGLLARLWRLGEGTALQQAEAVFTVGDRLAARLETTFDASRTRAGRVLVIPHWADTDRIRPLPKAVNPFVCEWDLGRTFTLLYSGNLGETHDVDTMLDAAALLADEPAVRLVVIGGGSRCPEVERRVRGSGLTNVLLLPLQPPDRLACTLSAADVAVVTQATGSEGLSVPSKAYYALAAGSAILAVAAPECELSDLVRSRACGLCVPPGDAAGFAGAVRRWIREPSSLDAARANARAAAEKEFGRAGRTRQWVEALRPYLEADG